jgi:hypothetical protein
MRKIIAITNIVLTGTASALAAPVGPPSRAQVEVAAIANGCSRGNPLYVLRGLYSTPMNVKVCMERRTSGYFERRFLDYRVGARTELGCAVDGGVYVQNYTIHWSEAEPVAPPINVTEPRNDIIVYQLGTCKAKACPYIISNRHATKPISITYFYRGRSEFYTIRPGKDLLALGISASPPVISDASFNVPYPPSSCNAGLDEIHPTRVRLRKKTGR